MKNFLKFPILFTVIAVSACRSHKTVEVSDYSTNDSCVVQTDLRVHSLANIEKNESIASRLTQDHMEFSEGAGEIRIYSNGEVSVKGLKSAYLIRHEAHKQSTITAAINDSLDAKSHIQSSKTTVAATKANAITSSTSSIWLKFILFMIIAILIIRIVRSR